MKKCPVCNAECFDDMDTCFECLHSFTHDAQEDKTPIEQMEEAAANSRLLRNPSTPNNDEYGGRDGYTYNNNSDRLDNRDNYVHSNNPDKVYNRGNLDCVNNHKTSHNNSFSFSFGGHENNSFGSAITCEPSSQFSRDVVTETHEVNQNFSPKTPESTHESGVISASDASSVASADFVSETAHNIHDGREMAKNASTCPPIEIPIDGRYGNVKCTILEDDEVLPTSDYDNSMQTWVLRLGLPADCEGVTVRLERA